MDIFWEKSDFKFKIRLVILKCDLCVAIYVAEEESRFGLEE